MHVQRAFIAALLGLALSACSAADDKLPSDRRDSASEPACPTDIESFCQYEFGGACPTHAEASTMTCSGHHFDATGASDGEPYFTGVGECPYPKISCVSEDAHEWTRVYFTEEGALGTIVAVALDWDDAQCGGTPVFGDPLC